MTAGTMTPPVHHALGVYRTVATIMIISTNLTRHRPVLTSDVPIDIVGTHAVLTQSRMSGDGAYGSNADSSWRLHLHTELLGLSHTAHSGAVGVALQS